MGRRKVNVTKIHCKHTDEAEKKPYHYTECGLDDVYLLSGYDEEPSEYGDVVSVRHADELHQAIGEFLVRNKKVLSGKELRFLRREMDLTQAELGKLLSVSDQSVARWEKDQNKISGSADHLIRVIFMEHIGLLDENMTIRDLVRALEDRDSERVDSRQMFTQENSDWKPVALAA